MTFDFMDFIDFQLHYVLKSIQSLIDQLVKIPGIGPRQATRIAYHILKRPAEDAKALAESIISARKIRACRCVFKL